MKLPTNATAAIELDYKDLKEKFNISDEAFKFLKFIFSMAEAQAKAEEGALNTMTMRGIFMGSIAMAIDLGGCSKFKFSQEEGEKLSEQMDYILDNARFFS